MLASTALEVRSFLGVGSWPTDDLVSSCLEVSLVKL